MDLESYDGLEQHGLQVYRTPVSPPGDQKPLEDAAQGAEVRFFGREAPSGPQDALKRVRAKQALQTAWLEQVHSTIALPARAGSSGSGDALHTGERGLALAIATADCVPVLLACGDRVAAAHAGWRGLADGVINSAIEALAAQPSTAWVGPAIGPCCYEVGDRVAAAVAAASSSEVVVPGPHRPHLDLPRAAVAQLRAAGVEDVRVARRCTRCDPRRWWSYRRDGARAGRNWSLIWLGRAASPR